MKSPIKLVTTPSAEEEVKANIISTLEEVIELTKTGGVLSVIMLVNQADETWRHYATDTLEFSTLIGRLEILKQDMMANHLAHKE